MYAAAIKQLPLRLFVITTIWFSLTPAVASYDEDNVRNASLKAIEANPEVEAKWHAFLATGYDHREAWGGYLPSVDVTAAGGRANRDFDGRGSYDRAQAEVSVTQMLFDGFGVRNDVRGAKHRQIRSYYELIATAERVALETFTVYQDIVTRRELVVLSQENYSNHYRVFQQIERRGRSGLSTSADLEQIQGRLALAESNLLTEAANLHDVTAQFLRLVGRPPGDTLAPAALETALIPENIRDALRHAYNGNPGFHAAITGIDVARSAADRRKANFLPQIGLRARHGINDNVNSFDRRFDPENRGEESAIELTFQYNLYRGGSDRAARRGALERVNEAFDVRDLECRNLRQSVQISHNDVRNLGERINSLRQHRDSSRLVATAYQEQFEIGRRALLDVLDAENESYQAQRAYLLATRDLETAKARTLSGMGELLETLEITRTALPSLSDINGQEIHIDPETTCGLQAASGLSRDDLVHQHFSLEADALFNTGQSSLTLYATESLDRLLSQLGDPEDIQRITIVGHTDDRGGHALNDRLSLARAESARAYFAANGIDAARITVEGRGSRFPISDNDSPEGREANRRIEISVLRIR